MKDSPTTWPQVRRYSLHGQLIIRFALVFLLVTVSGSLMAVLGYRALSQQAQSRSADTVAEHVAKRYAAVHENWLRNADEVKSQIDFMRVFAPEDQARNWLRLRAFFASQEGKLDRFPSGVVLDGQGHPVFQYGPEGVALSRRFNVKQSEKAWFYSMERRAVWVMVGVPLWLGSQGTGRLVMLQPLGNGELHQLTSPGLSLFLMHDDEVLASSGGSQDYGKAVRTAYTGRLTDNGRELEQRSMPAIEGEADGPRIVMQQEVQQIVSPLLVMLGTFTLLAMLTGVLWLVIGRWANQLTQRVGRLSWASVMFADEHALTEPVQQALDQAGVAKDEIGEVALASRTLMQSVLLHDKEQFAYLQTLNLLDEGVVELGADGMYRRASPGWSRLSGHDEGNFFEALHPEDARDLRPQFHLMFSGEKTSLSGRVRLRREDSKDLWIEYRFVAGEVRDGRVSDVRGVLRDITKSYQLEKHVTHMALHDALTGLPNRVLLEDRCKIALRTAERSGSKVALGFMDLDHFKHVNDQFGHKAGDELLMALSGALRQCLRSGDTLARWGGDEFVVLLTDVTGMDGVREAIGKLETICANPIKIDGNEFNPTFSMGVAMYPDDANTVETLLSQADRAMFSAKQQGRNTVRFFSDIAHREQDRKALYIQNRLATAIKEQQIQTWFQPIVDAKTLRVVSCEALARWHDETYGWVSPATFVPMAENLGLIREIGQQVWKQAIDNLHRWREMKMDMKMSVNVSRRQLFTPSFTADLLEDLDRLAIPVSVIDLEITESVAMEDAEHTTKRLGELTEAGFGIAIDDFGTGYSSLSQLHDMPASKIKIDISFVSRAHGEQGGQLIQAIVKIASAFRLQTVAEGVETAETAATLRAFGVDKLQGYHFGKPMNAEAFERYLLANFKKG